MLNLDDGLPLHRVNPVLLMSLTAQGDGRFIPLLGRSLLRRTHPIAGPRNRRPDPSGRRSDASQRAAVDV